MSKKERETVVHVLGVDVSGAASGLSEWSPQLRGQLGITADNMRKFTPELLQALASHVWTIDTWGKQRIPAIMGNSTGPFAVASPVRDWLSEHQPGRIDFHPVLVRSKQAVNGTCDHSGFYLMADVPILDPMIVEETAWAGVHPDGRRALSLDPRNSCVVRAELVRGMHFWRTSPRQGGRFMGSDDFLRFLKDNKLRGLMSDKTCQAK